MLVPIIYLRLFTIEIFDLRSTMLLAYIYALIIIPTRIAGAIKFWYVISNFKFGVVPEMELFVDC